jgi:hypothetical protein
MGQVKVGRRAPRAVRRGRKFRGRPTSHDGLDVIFAYGNRAGYTLDGRVAGRYGNNVVECADGFLFSVLAGPMVHCLPKVHLISGSWTRELWAHERHADYAGPYVCVEVWPGPPVRDFDVHNEELIGQPIPLPVVRALVRAHGGFARMRRGGGLHEMRAGAAMMARVMSEDARFMVATTELGELQSAAYSAAGS